MRRRYLPAFPAFSKTRNSPPAPQRRSARNRWRSWSAPGVDGDLAAVVDQLGLASFDLTGWIYGGALAAAYAAEHPERVGRLVLWVPRMRTSDSPVPGGQDMVQSIRASWPLFRRSISDAAFPTGPTDLQRWYSNMLRDSLTPEVAARHVEVASAEFDGRPVLRNVQAPTLVLANPAESESEPALSTRSQRDRAISTIASLIPDARLATLEGATQTLVNESFVTAMHSFLDEADSGSEAEN